MEPRSIENQLCLAVRSVEAAMMQPGFDKRRAKLFYGAQNTYWGALLTLMGMPKPRPEEFRPIHAELCRLRSMLTAFKK